MSHAMFREHGPGNELWSVAVVLPVPLTSTRNASRARMKRGFVDRANRIAESLQLGIAIHRGEGIVPPLQRNPSAGEKER